MAIDVYVKIGKIDGESSDGLHKDWIECTSVDWGVWQPKSATASTAGGHAAERCEHKDITFSKLADLSTPKLLEHCCAGTTFTGDTTGDAKFNFMRADTTTGRIVYFEIILNNVMISSVTTALTPVLTVVEGKNVWSNVWSEVVSLRYSNVKWNYTKQKITGGAGGKTSGGWNLEKNKVA